MGKVEDMQALKQRRREEWAAERRATAESDSPPPAAARPRAAASPGPAVPAVSADPATSPAGTLCGHRSIGNRSCTRPAGHAEKNHRYTPLSRT